MEEDLNEPFLDFVDLFEAMKIPYVLIGGLAVGVHGIPRPTHDVDFTIVLDRSKIKELFEASEELGYAVPAEYEGGWIDDVSGMSLVRVRKWMPGKSIDVDMFLAESRFQKSLIERREFVQVEDSHAWVATPEDLIILKLVAGRPRDIGDIMDIFLVQGQLDETYLRKWAEELAVTDRLERILAESRME